MSHRALSHVAHHAGFYSAAKQAAPAKPRRSVFRWLYDAVMQSRERQTQREIDQLVSWRDGGFNDRFEQEIAERSYGGSWNTRR